MREFPIRSIRAICFDLDDTLWPTDTVVHTAEVALYEWIKKGYPKITRRYTVSSLRESRLEFAQPRPDLWHDLTLLRTRHLEELFKEFGYRLEEVEGGMAVFLEYRNKVEPFPDVVSTLTILKSRYQLMSLTNGNASVEGSVLGHFFSMSLSSARAGFAKPDRRIFECLLQAAVLDPGEILHVGDNPCNDILGAAEAGLRTAWLNRDGKEWGVSPRPDLEIGDLHELCDMLMSRT